MVTLRLSDIFSCSKVRRNRKGMLTVQITDKDMNKGDSEFRTTYKGVRWLKWKDNRCVFFLILFSLSF